MSNISSTIGKLQAVLDEIEGLEPRQPGSSYLLAARGAISYALGGARRELAGDIYDPVPVLQPGRVRLKFLARFYDKDGSVTGMLANHLQPNDVADVPELVANELVHRRLAVVAA